MNFMATVYDVDANELIARVAEKLKDKLQVPEWAKYVKTAPNRERPPMQDDFWYIRAASILRNIYIHNHAGVSKLRNKYGGRIRNTHQRKEKRKASGKIIRVILQQLEAAGYLQKSPKGRILTNEGRSLLDKTANEIVNKK